MVKHHFMKLAVRMATPTRLFPPGIATGPAFCDREAERAALKEALLGGRHVWLWARRRIGKTSLIEQVRLELSRRRPAVKSMLTDLNAAFNDDQLARQIQNAAARLSVELLPARGKRHKQLLDAFAALKPEITLGAGPIRLNLTPLASVTETISETLLALNAAAAELDRRAVFVFDEFQQINAFRHKGLEATAIEGAIRHAAERATHISYVFCGSEKHLLQAMFEDPDRPLFRLCEKLTLGRIKADDYYDFLDRTSRAHWGRSLDPEVGRRIVEVTRRHPLYLNRLCSKLWAQKAAPTLSEVDLAWSRVAEGDASVAAEKVRRLSASQRAMLIGIAREGAVEQLTSRDFTAPLKLPPSTANQAREALEQEDFIREQDGAWVLIDPIVQSYLDQLLKHQ